MCTIQLLLLLLLPIMLIMITIIIIIITTIIIMVVTKIVMHFSSKLTFLHNFGNYIYFCYTEFILHYDEYHHRI